MVVISLGGSIVCGHEINSDYIKKFRNFLEEYSTHHKIFVVVGGGETARKYINVGKSFGFDEYLLDEIGIMATRLNGSLLLGKYSYPRVAKNILEAIIASSMYPVVVCGGTEPGHTTDGVALLLAESVGEKKMINITSVGGVYTKDPNKFPDARLIEKLSYEDAEKMFVERKMTAGLNLPFDLISLKIAERSNIVIYIIGPDIENLKKVINNESFKGTVIGNAHL